MADAKRYEKIDFLDELFPIKIIWNQQIGEERIFKEEAAKTWHEQLEILYVLKGKIRVDCGYRRYICDKGDIVVINSCEPHSVEYHSGKPVCHCFMIDPKLYEGGNFDLCGLKYMRHIKGRHLKFNNIISDNEKITAVLDDIITEYKEKKYAYEVAMKGDILLLLSQLFRSEISALYRDEKNISGSSNYELISPVFSYIADNYDKKLALDDFAALCCINPSHLCRVFKKVTGKTILDYLNEYRLSKAQVLLLTSDLSIGDIAMQVGYTDGGYFSRRFKALYGCSPGKFRDTQLKNEREE